jgi:two-component system, NtrC family, response regulator HydG
MTKSVIRMAVIDDDQGVLDLIRSAMEGTNVAVDAFLDPQAFLHHADIASYQIILSDLMFPKQTGIDLLRDVRERTKKPSFVIMTSHASVPTAVQAMKEGAFDYLAKPFRIQDLMNLVRRAGEASAEPVVRAAVASDRDYAVGRSSVWLALLEKARRVADISSTVLIRGETGTGKEVLARYIASHGPRAEKPFVALNCAALPENLIESELFGHVRGAFSGATNPRRGLFEEAHGGTLFLDEIGTMPLPAQAKLLRALEERQIRRVGDNKVVTVDARILAATNADLEEAVARRELREDLYYRLSVVRLVVPALRERSEDIPLLAEHFLAGLRAGAPAKTISPEALALLSGYSFPGNVRELKHAIEQAIVFSRGDELVPEDFALLAARADLSPSRAAPRELELAPATSVSPERLREALRTSRGSRVEAARLLGISRSTLYRLLRQMQPEPAERPRPPETDA